MSLLRLTRKCSLKFRWNNKSSILSSSLRRIVVQRRSQCVSDNVQGGLVLPVTWRHCQCVSDNVQGDLVLPVTWRHTRTTSGKVSCHWTPLVAYYSCYRIQRYPKAFSSRQLWVTHLCHICRIIKHGCRREQFDFLHPELWGYVRRWVEMVWDGPNGGAF